MGRNKKTELKTRSFWVYADTDEQAERWKKAAEQAGLKLSKYIREVLAQHLSGTSGETVESLKKRFQETNQQNEVLRQGNAELSNRVSILEVALQRIEEENKKLRSGTFFENNFQGIRELEQELVDLLKKEDYINETNILDKLHVNPRDVDATKTISKQLEILLDYGIIKYWKGGYKWQK